MAKTCAICGSYSGRYPLCRSCSTMIDTGEVLKCEECGVWHRKGDPCQCKPVKQTAAVEIIREKIIDADSELTCLSCGEPSNSKHFCATCYHRLKGKTLLLKVNKCQEFEILDESYEGLYICKDGHVVKSKSEREIDNYFFSNAIAHAYERALSIDGETFHPDFCLFINGQKVYLEHWGFDESNVLYTQQKQYKIPKYQKAGITLICTHEKYDAKDIEAALERKLSSFKFGQINFLEK